MAAPTEGSGPRIGAGRWLRVGLGALLLSAQLGAIVHARFVPSRYFAWAPYDRITLYRISAEVDGRRLTPAEIRARYGLPAHGRDNRAPRHVVDILSGYERTYGSREDARVLLRYRTNGGPERVWRHP